jgi:phosphatidylinositol alpha-mannosyltransferase
MNILLVSPFDFGYPGGVNEHIAQLDAEFRRIGHRTRVLAATSPEIGEVDDGHVYRLGAALPIPSNGSRARVTLSPFVTGRVKEFLRQEQFDIIHCHEPLAPMLPLAVLLHSKSANVGTFHAARTNNLWYMYTKALLDIFFQKIDARIAVSDAAREFVDAYFPGEYEIIPNGISLDRFNPDVPPLPELMDGRKNILFVGRFDESRKGFRYLVRAFPRVRGQFPDARLVVVGQGDRARYERFLEQHHIGPDDVIFAGRVDEATKARYYASCDVFCAPSTGRESFGIILLEALATGKPVVASDIPGYRDVVHHGIDGMLVAPKDANALALGLVRVLADAELRERLRANARERIVTYAWPNVARRVIEVYERALEAEPARPQQPWPSRMIG